MNIKDFEHDDWKSYFSGKWSVLTSSYWGSVYLKKPFSDLVNQYITKAVLIYEGDKGLTGYFRKSDVEIFSSALASQIRQNEKNIDFICDGLKSRVDIVLSLVDEYIDKDGNISMPFNCEGMYRAFKNKSNSEISIYK